MPTPLTTTEFNTLIALKCRKENRLAKLKHLHKGDKSSLSINLVSLNATTEVISLIINTNIEECEQELDSIYSQLNIINPHNEEGIIPR